MNMCNEQVNIYACYVYAVYFGMFRKRSVRLIVIRINKLDTSVLTLFLQFFMSKTV